MFAFSKILEMKRVIIQYIRVTAKYVCCAEQQLKKDIRYKIELEKVMYF